MSLTVAGGAKHRQARAAGVRPGSGPGALQRHPAKRLPMPHWQSHGSRRLRCPLATASPGGYSEMPASDSWRPSWTRYAGSSASLDPAWLGDGARDHFRGPSPPPGSSFGGGRRRSALRFPSMRPITAWTSASVRPAFRSPTSTMMAATISWLPAPAPTRFTCWPEAATARSLPSGATGRAFTTSASNSPTPTPTGSWTASRSARRPVDRRHFRCCAVAPTAPSKSRRSSR